MIKGMNDRQWVVDKTFGKEEVKDLRGQGVRRTISIYVVLLGIYLVRGVLEKQGASGIFEE